MKVRIIIGVLFFSLFACNEAKKETKKETKEIVPKVTEDKIEPVINDQLTDFVGLYEYEDKDNPRESLFLVLKIVDPRSIPNFEGYLWNEKKENGEVVEETLAGLLYGNTDLFQDVREGYAPGFFVANIQVEPFENNELKVSIDGDSSAIFENPLPFSIKSTKEALAKGYKIWEVTEMDISKNLIFEVKNPNELILRSDLGLDDKTFSKTK